MESLRARRAFGPVDEHVGSYPTRPESPHLVRQSRPFPSGLAQHLLKPRPELLRRDDFCTAGRISRSRVAFLLRLPTTSVLLKALERAHVGVQEVSDVGRKRDGAKREGNEARLDCSENCTAGLVGRLWRCHFCAETSVSGGRGSLNGPRQTWCCDGSLSEGNDGRRNGDLDACETVA